MNSSKKSTYPYEKCQYFESFYNLLKLGREVSFFSSKQPYPDFEKIITTQARVVKIRMTNLKELTILCLRNDVLLKSGTFQKHLDVIKKAYGNNPFYSYSTPFRLWEAGSKKIGDQLD